MRRSNTTRDPIQASPYSLAYEPIPRNANTPTIIAGSHAVCAGVIAPMSLSAGRTIWNRITSVDAASSMPATAATKTRRCGRT